MPTVGVFLDSLQAALGEVDEHSFDELCFEFGLELDEVTSDYEMAKKERGEEAAAGESKRVIFKVDVPANRYDLLCIEGLVRALKVFRGEMQAPTYALSSPKTQMRMTVHASTAQIRPFVVCAVLRGVTFDQDRYASFIDLQDKLHQNICRRRTLVAIGTHDLSTLTPPFDYAALPPKDIWFRPLNQQDEMDGNGMMEVLSTHQQLKAYLPIIRGSPVYPVIHDSKRVVLSVPPIINGDHSKIRLETKDVFIEATATDLTKANVVLNTVVAMFGEYCKEPFLVEPVEVVYADDYPGNSFIKPGDKPVYPQLDAKPMKADIGRMKSSLSLNELSGTQVRDFLRKMSVPCNIDKKDQNVLHVDVPITRSDIMHECDLVEDLAIAYGYNKLVTEVPMTFAGAAEQPINHLSDLLRTEMAMAGFTECLNWALMSQKENFAMMRREEKPEELWRAVAEPHEYCHSLVPVSLSNSKTKDFEIVRTSILPGLLKTLSNSKQLPPPIRLFEVGDIVIQEPTREVGSRNVRRIGAVHASMKSQFHVMHGALDQLMYTLFFEPEHEQKERERREREQWEREQQRLQADQGGGGAGAAAPDADAGAAGPERKEKVKRRTYKLVPSDDPAFFPGMQAHIVCEGITIGILGELHPEVLGSKGFDINLPTSAFEINVEPFLDWL